MDTIDRPLYLMVKKGWWLDGETSWDTLDLQV